VAGGVLEGYRRLSAGLLAGLAQLGVDATQTTPRQGVERRTAEDLSAVCFEAPSDYEILAGGRKLIGSAQFRARGGVLQHGTLPLCGDLSRILSLLALDDAQREIERSRLIDHATTLHNVLGWIVPLDVAAEALAQGFARALHLRLVPGTLTHREKALTAELRQTRYASGEWTKRR
jgi:lipoate-protein ligase A